MQVNLPFSMLNVESTITSSFFLLYFNWFNLLEEFVHVR